MEVKVNQETLGALSVLGHDHLCTARALCVCVGGGGEEGGDWGYSYVNKFWWVF